MVLFPEEFKVSRSLRKTILQHRFEVRADTAFREVMLACAEPRAPHGATWIGPDMVAAYCRLHDMGIAHSVETWQGGHLVGGLYGVALGRMFFGESMFSRVSDASKVALARLVDELRRRGFGMIDCQMKTPHLASLGAREIPREEFIRRLAELVNYADSGDTTGSNHTTGPWHFDSA
jgi:leucyl/phenylalanyl-tRNA--protein transferase